MDIQFKDRYRLPMIKLWYVKPLSFSALTPGRFFMTVRVYNRPPTLAI